MLLECDKCKEFTTVTLGIRQECPSAESADDLAICPECFVELIASRKGLRDERAREKAVAEAEFQRVVKAKGMKTGGGA